MILKCGDRVLVFDHLLYRDDRSTPLTITMRPATVVNPPYTEENYPVMVDIVFDHRPERISRSHFIWAITPA